ncbi:hypothetical protein FRX31_008927 [Thalictrum thalictroides]|uniref:Uncharacterized protein n=1 Tax=Thalictrum thalictroides TaxID=46969 RepID=A0A7J6WVN9_THATH|nr:hypothetical protein FRX31_008927 [Thalictrum thalictroides]
MFFKPGFDQTEETQIKKKNRPAGVMLLSSSSSFVGRGRGVTAEKTLPLSLCDKHVLYIAVGTN